MSDIIETVEDCFSGIFINPSFIQSVSPIIEHKDYKFDEAGKNGKEYISYYFAIHTTNKTEQSAFFKKKETAERIRVFIIDLIVKGGNLMLIDENEFADNIYMIKEEDEDEEEKEEKDFEDEDEDEDEDYEYRN